MEVLICLLCLFSFCILGIISCVLWGALIGFVIDQTKKSSRRKSRYIPSNSYSAKTSYSSNDSYLNASSSRDELTQDDIDRIARDQMWKEREEEKKEIEIEKERQDYIERREAEDSLNQQIERESIEREREEEERERWEEIKRQRYEDE